MYIYATQEGIPSFKSKILKGQKQNVVKAGRVAKMVIIQGQDGAS